MFSLLACVLLVATSASAVTYTTYFDADTSDDWFTGQGTWDSIDNPLSSDPTDLLYRGTPGVTGMASSYLWDPPGGVTNNIPTNGLSLSFAMGMQAAGTAGGAFFGSSGEGVEKNQHSVFLYQDTSNRLFFGVNLFSEDSTADYTAYLGIVGTGADFEASDAFLVNIAIDALGSLSWSVTVRDENGYDWQNTPYTAANVMTVDERTGVMGVFTKGAVNNFGYFSASSPVPVPGTFALLGFGLLGLAAVRRKR